MKKMILSMAVAFGLMTGAAQAQSLNELSNSEIKNAILGIGLANEICPNFNVDDETMGMFIFIYASRINSDPMVIANSLGTELGIFHHHLQKSGVSTNRFCKQMSALKF
jgi:hypothetical protein